MKATEQHFPVLLFVLQFWKFVHGRLRVKGFSKKTVNFIIICLQVSALYGLNHKGKGRGLLKWDYDGNTVLKQCWNYDLTSIKAMLLAIPLYASKM